MFAPLCSGSIHFNVFSASFMSFCCTVSGTSVKVEQKILTTLPRFTVFFLILKNLQAAHSLSKTRIR